MFSLISDDKELIEALRRYRETFKIELIEEEILKEAEKGGVHILGLPSVDKEVLKKKIEQAIKNLSPLKDPDIFLELGGFSSEEIERYKKGLLIIE